MSLKFVRYQMANLKQLRNSNHYFIQLACDSMLISFDHRH